MELGVRGHEISLNVESLDGTDKVEVFKKDYGLWTMDYGLLID